MIRRHMKLPGSAVACLAACSLMLPAFVDGAAAAAEEEAAPSEAEQYGACVELSGRAPRQAFEVASDWLVKGGGVPAQHCAALSLAGLGRHDEAARALEASAEELRIAKMNGDYTGFFRRGEGLVGALLGQAGNAWLLAGDPIQAYTAFSQGLSEVEAGSRQALELTIDRARASGVAADFTTALEDLDRAEALAPDRVEIFVMRASVHRKLDQQEEAAADLERAFELTPDNREALLERGNLRLMTGDVAGAEADWFRIIALYPDSPAAGFARTNITNLNDTDLNEVEEAN